MKVLHIIDASNHVYRGASVPRPFYYGQELINGELQSKSVLHGGFTALLDYIPMLEKSYFFDPEIENYYAICFDSRTKTHKKIENPTYKANRKYDPETCAHAQMEYAEAVLKEYGYVVCREEGYEADDIAYSLWKKYGKDYSLVVLHSTDKDWSFMINDDTVQFAKRKIQGQQKYEYRIIDPTSYTLEFKVQYNLMLFNKVLKGDTSDGVKGVGMKWFDNIKEIVVDKGLSPASFGDVRTVRDVLLAVGERNPNFPVNDAMSVLDLVTPELINVDRYAYELFDSRPKKLPINYILTTRPQTRSDVHKDLFYDFVERCRSER